MDQIDEYVLEESITKLLQFREIVIDVLNSDSSQIEKLIFMILLASDIADNIKLINDVLISIFDEYFFFFRFEKMDFIFQSKIYKKEYKELLKILPKLNDGNLCLKLKCHEKCTSRCCKDCGIQKRGTCDYFMKIRDTLFENPNKIAADYVFFFSIDYFNTNDFTRQFFNLDISKNVTVDKVFVFNNNKIQKIKKNYVN